MLRTKESRPNVRMHGWEINGVRVKRQSGMIYWYSWGKHEFDIRMIRRVLGRQETRAADTWFMAAEPDWCGSFTTLMMQLQTALGDRHFRDVIAEHDRLFNEPDRVGFSEKARKG